MSVSVATGWWFVVEGYEEESPVGRVLGVRDGEVHELAGQAAVVLVGLWVVVRARAVVGFFRASVRFRAGDGRWFADLPRAAFDGRFGGHDGHFDPGQRVANLAITGTLGFQAFTGLSMVYFPLPGDVLTLHRYSAYLITALILGHVVVTSGVLPGYRGVWRSMHLGGRLPVEVARRLWPGWTERHTSRKQ